MAKQLRCVSPIDGSIYAKREPLAPAAAAAAVAKAKEAQNAWADADLDHRIELVMDAVEKICADGEKLTVELAWQMGRPVRYGGEFSGFKERARHMADIAPQALAPTVIEDSGQFCRKIVREPQGVVLVVAPWNYPYMTAINTVAPALIAGNAVVLKHATQTLKVGTRMEEAFLEAGLPEGVFQNLPLEHSTTASLIADGSFGFVNFTGSVGAGAAIEKAAAGTFTSIGLELGGKDPGYVMEDADPSDAAAALIDGAMFNSGQCCCGIERIYVAEKIFDDFVAAAVALVEGYKLGDPLREDTTLGPMAHQRFADQVREQTEQALASGAKALIDQSRFPEDDGGTYLMPQILVDVDHGMALMREESFGPVVGIMPTANDDEAIALMNDSDFGLTASLWTADEKRAAAIGSRLATGTVFMNRCDYLDPALCWTGRKQTGRGSGLSALGYLSVTLPKSYHLKKN